MVMRGVFIRSYSIVIASLVLKACTSWQEDINFLHRACKQRNIGKARDRLETTSQTRDGYCMNIFSSFQALSCYTTTTSQSWWNSHLATTEKNQPSLIHVWWRVTWCVFSVTVPLLLIKLKKVKETDVFLSPLTGL